MAAKGAELTRGGNWFRAGAHRGERAGRRVSPQPAAPSQDPGSIHQGAHWACSGARGARGVGTGTRACVAVLDAARTPQCRDLSHSTAGLARSSHRERPGALMVDTAAAGGRRWQEQWRFRYPSGAKRGGRAAAEAPGKCPSSANLAGGRVLLRPGWLAALAYQSHGCLAGRAARDPEWGLGRGFLEDPGSQACSI